MTNDPIAEALAELHVPAAPDWKWEKPGDQVAGVMVAYRKEHRRVRDADGKPRSVTVISYTLETPDGPVSIWASPIVLRNEMRRARIGDAVAIRFLGEATTADGERSYAAFDVVVKRPDPTIHIPTA